LAESQLENSLAETNSTISGGELMLSDRSHPNLSKRFRVLFVKFICAIPKQISKRVG